MGLLIVEPRTSRRRRFRRAARTADTVAICVPRHSTALRLRAETGVRHRLCSRLLAPSRTRPRLPHSPAARPGRAPRAEGNLCSAARAPASLCALCGSRPSVALVLALLGLHAAASRESGLGAARANDMIARHDDERLPSVPPSNVPLAIPDAITACARLEACNHGSCTQEQERRAAKQKAKQKPLAVGGAASSLSSQRHRAAHAPPRARDPRAAARRAESSGASTPSAPPSFFCSWARCR